MSECSSDERPIIITRLVEETGWSMAGASETLGSA
jgi:hypothetical protein